MKKVKNQKVIHYSFYWVKIHLIYKKIKKQTSHIIVSKQSLTK